jgi:hypothetical protein
VSWFAYVGNNPLRYSDPTVNGDEVDSISADRKSGIEHEPEITIYLGSVADQLSER